LICIQYHKHISVINNITFSYGLFGTLLAFFKQRKLKHMKRSLFISVLFLMLTAFTVSTSLLDVVRSINNGDAASVAKYFDNSVEMVLPGKSSTYSKSQAELILKDFFYSNPVVSFKVLHQGEKGGSEYCIGTLETKNAKFRTTFFMKNKGDKQWLQEIRFEN